MVYTTILEKLIVIHLARKFPAFMEPESLLLVCQFSPVYILTTHAFVSQVVPCIPFSKQYFVCISCLYHNVSISY